MTINFLHASDTSVAPELHRKCMPRYFTLVAQGIGLPHMDNTQVVGFGLPNVNSWLFSGLSYNCTFDIFY